MSDNVTTIEIASFASWGIPLLSAFGGALFAVLIKETYEWVRNPRLKIDFEERQGVKPWFYDASLGETILGLLDRAKYLRLTVSNVGRKPALDCIAKIEVVLTEDNDHAIQTIHWARRDPKVYLSLDQIYASIHLNPKDKELLDVLNLEYKTNIENGEPEAMPPGTCLETLSPYSIVLERNKHYRISVAVYASNTTSKPFILNVYWDGTLEGFNKAFTKIQGVNHLAQQTL